MRAASVLRRLRRAVLAAATLAAFACVICWLRQPDAETAGGRFDRGENAIRFDGSGGSTHPNGDIALRQRFDTLKRNRVRLLYVPFDPEPPPGGAEQAGRLLKLAGEYGVEVIPQVGGIYEDSARPAEPEWRTRFVRSVARLLDDHPEFAGIQLRIESLPGGNADYLKLLDKLRPLVGPRRLEAAAYPPPSWFRAQPEVCWSREFLTEVAERCDRMTVRMHHTGLSDRKHYIRLMRIWTRELLDAAKGTDCRLLFELPAGGTADNRHDPAAENLAAALRGVQAGLNGHDLANYLGCAVDSEREMTSGSWSAWQAVFCGARPEAVRDGSP